MKTDIVPYLVRRFLRFDKNQPFIFLSALLAFLGIMLGVMVLIVAMGLMNGFDEEFKKKLSIMNYPLTILPKFYASVDESLLLDLEQKFPNLKFSPYVTSTILAKNGNHIEGGYLFGVNFKDELQVNSILREGAKDVNISKFQVLAGKSLVDEFGMKAHGKITYVFTDFEPGGLSVAPKMKRFKVQATYDSGLSAYDKAYSFTTLESLQKIQHLPSNIYDGIHVYSADPQKDIVKLKDFVGDEVSVRGWWEDNSNFFAALQMEKTSLFIVLMLIILIASVNIISSLLMTVMNRRSEIALLISLGASTMDVKKVFLYLGVIIGLAGIAMGTVLGLSLNWVLATFDIIHLPADVYPTSRLPVNLETLDFFLIIIGAFFIVLASSYYPAKKASEVDVLMVLRNE